VIPLATSTPGTISWVSFDVPLNEYCHFIGCIIILRWARWPMKTILTRGRLSDWTARYNASYRFLVADSTLFYLIAPGVDTASGITLGYPMMSLNIRNKLKGFPCGDTHKTDISNTYIFLLLTLMGHRYLSFGYFIWPLKMWLKAVWRRRGTRTETDF